MPPVRNPYQPWEEEIIRVVYPIEGAPGCMARGIKRSHQAIRTKAFAMGVQQKQSARIEACRRAVLKFFENKDQARTPWELPEEYLGATDIFQVGYLTARNTGTLSQFVRQS